MSELKKTIRADLTAAMKAKDELTRGALRMLLAAIQTEEVSGAKHELTDDDVVKVIAREVKKRRESATVYQDAGRSDLAEHELNEVEVLQRYQPKQLDDDEITALVAQAIATVQDTVDGDVTMKQMGQVMKAATALAAGRADGSRLSAAVRAALQ